MLKLLEECERGHVGLDPVIREIELYGSVAGWRRRSAAILRCPSKEPVKQIQYEFGKQIIVSGQHAGELADKKRERFLRVCRPLLYLFWPSGAAGGRLLVVR